MPMIAIAGILHLVVAYNVLGGLEGIIGSLVEPGLLTATFSIAEIGILLFGSWDGTTFLVDTNDKKMGKEMVLYRDMWNNSISRTIFCNKRS